MTRIPSPSLSGLAPRFLSAVLLTALLTVPLVVPAHAFQSPSPESLRLRAEEYWRLLVSGDRFGASQFMRPEDRPAFLQGREQPFRDPTVGTIDCPRMPPAPPSISPST